MRDQALDARCPVFSEEAARSDDAERRPLQVRLPSRMPALAEPVGVVFPELFAAHFDYVWHALRRLGVRESDLEDVTHDVFLAVFKKLDRYDSERPLRPWLFGFAFRFASDYRELARHRFEVATDPSDRQDEGPNALERALQSEALAIAREALATLELGRRAVFILHELDECPMPEVARALDIPLNTAYSRLRLARADLSSALRRLRLKEKT